jgi:hypothetical protein
MVNCFSLWPMRAIVTTMSGWMRASSQASRLLSTASLTAVSSALRGLSKPSRWRFLVKNSDTEISRWRLAIDSAVSAARPFLSALSFAALAALASVILSVSGSKRSCWPVEVLMTKRSSGGRGGGAGDAGAVAAARARGAAAAVVDATRDGVGGGARRTGCAALAQHARRSGRAGAKGETAGSLRHGCTVAA